MTEVCKGQLKSAGKPSKRKQIGRAGEEIAIAFYKRHGFTMLECNWHAGRFAEVDLIFKAPDGSLVFVEVKTRTAANRLDMSGQDMDSGLQSVSWRKRRKILIAARIYLSRLESSERSCRFDVLLVRLLPNTFTRPGDIPEHQVLHVPDAFYP